MKPYECSTYNVVDVILCLALSLFYFSAVASRLALTDYIVFMKMTGYLLGIFGSVPLIYITIVILSRLFPKLPLENPEECAELLREPVVEV